MKRQISTILLLLVTTVFVPAGGGCADNESEADRLVRESDTFRTSATDAFRQTTARMDALVKDAAAGEAISPAKMTEDTDTAKMDLDSALVDLSLRDQKLQQASDVASNERYREYIALLKQSNEKMKTAINAALEIPTLLAAEKFSLAGWDEIKAQVIVSQIYAMEIKVEQAYGSAETLRNRAEQMKKDYEGDF